MKKLIFLILLSLPFYSAYAEDRAIKITENLEVVPLTGNIYLHVSYYDIFDYRHLPANGLIYINRGKAFIIDTPWTDQETWDLINWLNDSLKVSVAGVIVTHWHIDNLGGLKEMHSAGIQSYANQMTCEITAAKGLPVPMNCFSDSLLIDFAGKKIKCLYLGAGHALDNIIVWLPEEKTLFGGCLLKALDWHSLGFTGDADLEQWPVTLKKLKDRFADSTIVIPGHGEYGDMKLVDHTLELLEERR